MVGVGWGRGGGELLGEEALIAPTSPGRGRGWAELGTNGDLGCFCRVPDLLYF